MKLLLTKNLKEQFASFLENHPPEQFSSSLRSMMLDYMISQVDTGFPLDFKRFLWSLDDLFRLLDTALAEIQKQTASG